jgi:hypothetical protein
MKAFCKQSAIKVVPCAHVYVDGELNDTLGLGPRAWASFAERLEELLGEPASEVIAAEIPEEKPKRTREMGNLEDWM